MRRPFYTLLCLLVVPAFYSTSQAQAQSPLDRLEAGIRSGAASSSVAPDGQAGQQLPPPPAPPAAQPPDGLPSGAILPGTTSASPMPPAVRPVPSQQRGYLGAIVDDRSELGRGLRVLSVAPGGPADRGGLKPRDLVYGVGGMRVRQMRDITTAMSKFGPGDKVAIDFQRGVRLARVEVQLGSAATHVATPSVPNSAVAPPAAPPAVPPVPPSLPEDSSVATGSSPTATERPIEKSVEKPIIPPPPSDPATITLPTEDKPPVAPPVIDIPKPNGPALEAPDARIETMQKKIDDLEARIARLEQELAEAKKK